MASSRGMVSKMVLFSEDNAPAPKSHVAMQIIRDSNYSNSILLH